MDVDRGGKRRPPARGADVFRVNVAGESLVVLSMPSQPTLPVELSRAEREVVRLILEGLSNAEIADRRGCASRTVANQIASIYRKLRVASRRALVARLLGKDGSK